MDALFSFWTYQWWAWFLVAPLIITVWFGRTARTFREDLIRAGFISLFAPGLLVGHGAAIVPAVLALWIISNHSWNRDTTLLVAIAVGTTVAWFLFALGSLRLFNATVPRPPSSPE